MSTAVSEERPDFTGDLSEKSVFLVRAGSHNCALDLACVVEILRPTLLEPVSGAPKIVLGLSIVRGVPVPVVDLAGLFDESCGAATRLVIVKTGARRVALLVDEVIGIQQLPSSATNAVAPLLEEAAAGAIESIGTLDSELFLLLKPASIVREELLAQLASGKH